MAIRIPKTGALSRKERDELKAFGTERGLRVFDDAKRLERDFPEAMAEVRERTGATEEDLLLLAGWAGEPKGQRPEETVLQACGQLRLFAGAEIQRPAQAARPEELRVPVGGRFPDVRMGRRREPLERRASSVHVGARRRSRKADRRSGALPREILRPGAERHRAGLGLDSYSSPRRAGEGVSALWASATKKRSGASASCWTRSNTARRRTAASRSAWTGW